MERLENQYEECVKQILTKNFPAYKISYNLQVLNYIQKKLFKSNRNLIICKSYYKSIQNVLKIIFGLKTIYLNLRKKSYIDKKIVYAFIF